MTEISSECCVLAVLMPLTLTSVTLIAMIGWVEPPIDPDRRAAINLAPARYDDPFPIGLAPYHPEACAAEGAAPKAERVAKRHPDDVDTPHARQCRD